MYEVGSEGEEWQLSNSNENERKGKGPFSGGLGDWGRRSVTGGEGREGRGERFFLGCPASKKTKRFDSIFASSHKSFKLLLGPSFF